MNQTPDDNETRYEKNQRFNMLVSWLHSVRYRNVLRIFADISRKVDRRTIRVVDIGCAHGKLFSVLNEHFAIDYTGIEIEPTLVARARATFGDQSNFRILHDSVLNSLPHLEQADAIVALETCEHIPEHEVVRVIEAIAAARPGVFICSVPVEVGPVIWLKNVGSLLMGYMRHNEYRWSETFWAGLYQLDKLPPHGTGHKGFDWRWLAQTIRHNMHIIEVRRFPLGILPTPVATSVCFIAEPRRLELSVTPPTDETDLNGVLGASAEIRLPDSSSRSSAAGAAA